MKRYITLLAALACLALACRAQNVTIRAVDEPAAEVFRSIVGQTGKNFVYPSELLRDMRVSVDVRDMPLNKALDVIFLGSDVTYRIRGRNIVLKRKHGHKAPVAMPSGRKPTAAAQPISWDAPNELEEVLVVSRLEAPAVETAEIGAKKLTSDDVNSTPVLFGESDVLKTLQLQPGVSNASEGMAGMHVHGGNADENLFMLNNVPLYQVNHFAGLFSAFNVDAIRYMDFFKSSVPAKYDGRLSSFLDVRTKDGSADGHHGSFRLGLTSGALNIGGPLARNTTYAVALRRSWFDAISVPLLAINNASSDETIRLRYAFMDLNGKVTHRFNSRARGFVSLYFGDDNLKTGTKDKDDNTAYPWREDDKFDLHWGNLVAQAGLDYAVRPELTAEFSAAYTRYFSGMKHNLYLKETTGSSTNESRSVTHVDNNINDWILRADFEWKPTAGNRVRFGASYTLHRFLPSHTSRTYTLNNTTLASADSTWAYTANEANAYIEDDWRLNSRLRLNAGFHGSMFRIAGRTRFGAGPRLSVSYRPAGGWAAKAAYSRTIQYVHQLCQTYLSLPTDQWVPITGRFKPQTADKISLGGYWQSPGGGYAVSLEAYYKAMHNLVDYRDEYYLLPPDGAWTGRLCSGRGTARGIDLKIEKNVGRLSGHLAYSLAWADRTFADKNGGHTFPARFDHRHTINILLNWRVSNRVQLNAAWTGHSGNRFTLLSQSWELPYIDSGYSDDAPLRAPINNYQLPFYHRLDLSCTVTNRRGYWNFGLYNAYCHLNTVAIRRTYTRNNVPVFQKVSLLPVIPSISYTWLF